MSVAAKCIAAVLLLIGAATTASAQSYWYNGDYGLKQRGYYGTPYGGGPQYSSGGGDQYGYGPAYSYAKQAPEPSPFAPPPCLATGLERASLGSLLHLNTLAAPECAELFYPRSRYGSIISEQRQVESENHIAEGLEHIRHQQ